MAKRVPLHQKKGSKRKERNYDIDGFSLLRGDTIEELVRELSYLKNKFK